MASSLLPPVLCVLLVCTARAGAPQANLVQESTNSSAPAVSVNISSVSRPEQAPTQSEVTQKPAEVTTSTTTPSLPTNPPAPLEDPKIAATKTQGGLAIFKDQVAVPDTVKVPKVLGSKCTASADCVSINNTSCIDNLCDCISGFIPSKHSLDRCMKVPTGLEDVCEEVAQCAHVVQGSECRGGKCSCPPNYVFDMNRCWEKQLPGGMCNTSLQCSDVKFSMCVQGACACQTPLIPSSNNKCLQPAGTDYRAACEEDIQCTVSYGDEAHCSNSQCVCTNNFHFNGSICVADKKIGEHCLVDEDCVVSDNNNIEDSRACIKANCACATGFTILPGEDICTKSSGEELAVSLTWFLCIVIAKYYLS